MCVIALAMTLVTAPCCAGRYWAQCTRRWRLSTATCPHYLLLPPFSLLHGNENTWGSVSIKWGSG